MKRFICWWQGHVIKATICKDVETNFLTYVYHCERCNCLLPGPRP